MRGERKIKKYIIYYIVLISGVVVSLVLPKYNQHVFVLKHTLIYILAASIIIMVIKKIYNRLLIKYKHIFIDKKLLIFKGFTIFTIIGLLAISRYFQIDYIKLYETPPIVYCYYYDEYGNYIHGSRIAYVCPELEIINKTDHSLTFRAEYIYPGNRQDHLSSDGSGPWYRGHDGYALVDIEIEYNDDHYITSYTAQTSMNYELLEFSNTDSLDDKELIDEGWITKYYHSLLLSIKTTYSDDKVSQTQKYYTKELNDIDYETIREIEHYDFSNSEPSYVSSLDLLVTNRSDDYLEFEVYNLSHENRLSYLGHIDYSQDSTVLFYERNPEFVNVNPKEISNTYIFSDDHITKTYVLGEYSFNYEYSKLKDYKVMIQTVDDENKREIYDLDDSVIVEGKFPTYKMYQTSYGYKVEEYWGDHHREEIPYSDESYLTEIFVSKDNFVLDIYNPIPLEHEQQPIIQINPILKYVLDKNK